MTKIMTKPSHGKNRGKHHDNSTRHVTATQKIYDNHTRHITMTPKKHDRTTRHDVCHVMTNIFKHRKQYRLST